MKTGTQHFLILKIVFIYFSWKAKASEYQIVIWAEKAAAFNVWLVNLVVYDVNMSNL